MEMKGEVNRQNSDDIIRFLEGMASSDDVLFGFLDEGNESPEAFRSSGDDENEEDDDENGCSAEENKAFWESQEQLLQATLYRTTSIEAKIRQATKEALKEVKLEGLQCVCPRPTTESCRNCLRREISSRLRNAGYDCSVCKSKWRSSPDIPSGEHEYLEVVDKSSSKKGEIRVVIELAFQAEFEIAKASEGYKRLISRLPEAYVGKADRLKSLIKILCAAAKKCMKDKKMHMGPWRKHKYMQAKWLGTCERTTTVASPDPSSDGYSNRQQEEVKPRPSMLTFGLLDMRRSAVAVV